MTIDEARMLYAKLAAAFPAARLSGATESVYVEALHQLHQPRALEAVNEAIHSHTFAGSLPTVAAVIDQYRRLRSKYTPLALNEAPVSDEQRIENLRRIRAITAELVKPVADRQWGDVIQ